MNDKKKLHLKIHKLVSSLFIGNYLTAFKGRGLEFSDYILYEEGSDAKLIDWIASKREGKMLIKRYQEERQLQVFFLLDTTQSMHFGFGEAKKLSTLEEVFYLLAYSAISNNDCVGALVFNEHSYSLLPPKKGKLGLQSILQSIQKSTGNISHSWNHDELLGFFNSLPIKNSLVFVCSDKIDDWSEKNLKIAGLKNDVIFVNIFDSFENHLASGPYVQMLGNAQKTLFLNLRDEPKRRAYEARRTQRIASFHSQLLSHRIHALALDEKSNIFQKFFTLFHTRT